MLALMLLGSTVLAADAVRLTPVVGAAASVDIVAVGPSVHIPVCRGVSWERFDEERSVYVAVPADPCGGLSPARTLDKEATRFGLSSAVKTGDVVRAVVVVGHGCLDGRPFPLAACERVETVVGPTMTVKRGLLDD